MYTTRTSRITAILPVLMIVAASCGGANTSSVEGPSASQTAGEGSAGPNVLDESLTEYRQVTLPELEFGEASPTCVGESDGVLRFGGLLPETGNLSFLGPPEISGINLAVADINKAGGVLGADIEYLPGDSSDNGDLANQTVDRHLEADVDVIVGAASSGVSFQVLDKVGDACKVMFSPAATSPDFTTKDPDDIFFRTSPSDVAQGQVLADLIASDGASSVAIMALQDPYGEGLLKFVKQPLEEAGVSITTDFTYDPKAPSFDAEVERVTSSDPDAIVVIGFEETAEILGGLFEAGTTNDQIFLVDGNIGNTLGEKFEPGKLSGIRGTFPAAEITSDFKERMVEDDPELKDFTYGPEAYDAIIITALAATAANSDNPSEIAKRINGITKDGEECNTYETCAELLAEGTDIAYVGPSGPSEFSRPGERSRGSMAIVQYG